MILLKTLLKHPNNVSISIFLLFLFLHLVFFNINSAEWGDSYRILRASTYIQQGNYPEDEKRPPLYSALLATKPLESIDWVGWSRITMFVVSMVSFYVFLKLAKELLQSQNARNLALLLFSLNNVVFYWSIRIYADIFFGLLVMLGFYCFIRYKNSAKLNYLFLTGLLGGLSILTRFEGYIFVLALASGIVFRETKHKSGLLKKLVVFLTPLALIVIPYLLYRNPFRSSYFEETQQRGLDILSVLAFLVSFLFITGFIQAFVFVRLNSVALKKTVQDHLEIILFCVLELILIFLWPAAIPRLFVPIIPFITIYLVHHITNFFSEPTSLAQKKPAIFAIILLTAFFTLIQFKLRLQFLAPQKYVFLFLVAWQVPILFAIFKRNIKLLLVFLIPQLLLLMNTTIYLHKDLYSSVQEVSQLASNKLTGRVAYNDVNSVANWYLNYDRKSEQLSGVYTNFDDKHTLTQEYLKQEQIDYLIITNEHNTELEIDLQKRPYLEKILEKKYNRGGKMFFTWLIKVH